MLIFYISKGTRAAGIEVSEVYQRSILWEEQAELKWLQDTHQENFFPAGDPGSNGPVVQKKKRKQNKKPKPKKQNTY